MRFCHMFVCNMCVQGCINHNGQSQGQNQINYQTYAHIYNPLSSKINGRKQYKTTRKIIYRYDTHMSDGSNRKKKKIILQILFG